MGGRPASYPHLFLSEAVSPTSTSALPFEPDGKFSSYGIDQLEKLKQVIVVNESLKLPRGKLAAQVAHASVASLLTAGSENIQTWLNEGMTKVVLAGSDEAEVLRCYEKALAANVPAHLIRDAGRTVVASGTITCVGIGPASEDQIDKITAELKLVK